MSARKIEIRRATAADLPAAVLLFCARDQVPRPSENVASYVEHFDPARCLAWLAFDGDRPVGMTMLYLRTMHAGDRALRVGYWGNLFVHPDYRRAMVYPRLPLTMFKGAKEAGLDCVLTATRRPEVSAAHIQLGCGEVGDLVVRMKPLRPTRLLGVVKKHPRLTGPLGALPDAVFGLGLRLFDLPDALRYRVEELPLDGPGFDELADLRNVTSALYVHRHFAAGEYRARFRSTLEGDRYVALGVRRGLRIVAGVVYRLADRKGVCTGVLLDIVAAASEEDAARASLRVAEQRARDEGAVVMLHLDGLAEPLAGAIRSLGYLRSAERYKLLVWPRDSSIPRYWFDFADHDAF